MEESLATLDITVHKSHLVTIGERLYTEGFELLRELVNNAYDADATEVHIRTNSEEVVVEDNGAGMDLAALRQYFNIGSPEKRLHSRSPRFGRDRIGEFGIGKFAGLSAARHYEVWTKRGSFQATVVYDKTVWEYDANSWSLPLHIEPANSQHSDGTRVTLRQLTKRFVEEDIETRLIETLPIQAPDFAVYFNGKRLTPRPVAGVRFPFLEGTPYGTVHGEIIVVPASQLAGLESGIACRVKQVLVKREFFSLAAWGPIATRVTGEAHADFLPLTSDRNDFIRDSEPFQAFCRTMETVLSRVHPAVEQLANMREKRRTQRVLHDVLERLKGALIRNPAYCPQGLLPIGEETRLPGGQPAAIASAQQRPAADESSESPVRPKSSHGQRKVTKRPQAKRLSPSAVIRRLKLGQQGLSCCIDHLGAEAPECYTEGTIVYMNQDHPLHQQFVKDNRQAYALYLARLLSQEIALMKQPRSPRQAFECQGKLLRDAFCI